MNSVRRENDYHSLSADQRLRLLDGRITVDYSDSVNLPSYFRVCRSMLVMAHQYAAEMKKINAYCLERRFVFLFVDYISKRADFLALDPNERQFWMRECKSALARCEELRAHIHASFKDEVKDYQKTLAQQQETSALNAKSNHSPSSVTGASAPVTPSPTSNGLMPVYLPNSLAGTFMRVAEPNTMRNLETCATLCGRLSNGNEFIISHLIFCKQVGTPNSCCTTNEEDIVAYMDEHNLIALGWIHTHPTQSVFMSSIDLHCQLSYQIMLPEAVSIVCSPRLNETRCFSLTPDYGINFLKGCQETGFHSHAAIRDLYTDSPHVIRIDVETVVVDLR